jgi:hypothetical protein
MTNGMQNITKSPLGRLEAQFLAKIGVRPTFSAVYEVGPSAGRL